MIASEAGAKLPLERVDQRALTNPPRLQNFRDSVDCTGRNMRVKQDNIARPILHYGKLAHCLFTQQGLPAWDWVHGLAPWMRVRGSNRSLTLSPLQHDLFRIGGL